MLAGSTSRSPLQLKKQEEDIAHDEHIALLIITNVHMRKSKKGAYGPVFHQHQGLPAHSASLSDEPHRVHHSA